MNLAASTLFCLSQELEKAIPDLLKLTVNRVEVADSGYHTLNDARVRRLKELRETYGLSYSVHAPYADTNLSADDDEIRRTIVNRLKGSIVFAKELEARALVFHPGWENSVTRFDEDRTWRLNIESICEILEFARNQKVTALVENMPGSSSYLLKSIQEFHNFFEDVGLGIKMVLDVAHANTSGELMDFLFTFQDRIAHVHFSDNNGVLDSHLSIGEGNIDWSSVIRWLESIGFDGWIVLESYERIQDSIEYISKLIS
jgi:sugar phosphate isomerase/epimerase